MRLLLLSLSLLLISVTYNIAYGAEVPFKLSAGFSDSETIPSNVGIIGLRYLHQSGAESVVLEVYAGTPAERAGIRVGDKIVEVEGLDVRPYDANQIYQIIAGKPGEPVTLKMRRCGYRCADYMVKLVRVDMNSIPSDRVFKIYKYGL